MGEEQDSGFRIRDSGFRRQESAVRSQNDEHQLSADCLLPVADCLLHLREIRDRGTLGPYRSLRQGGVLAGKEETLVTFKNERTTRECL